MDRNFSRVPGLLVMALMLMIPLLRASDNPRQSVNIELPIPNEAFKHSFVVNLSPGQKVRITGTDEELLPSRARRLQAGGERRENLSI